MVKGIKVFKFITEYLFPREEKTIAEENGWDDFSYQPPLKRQEGPFGSYCSGIPIYKLTGCSSGELDNSEFFNLVKDMKYGK